MHWLFVLWWTAPWPKRIPSLIRWVPVHPWLITYCLSALQHATFTPHLFVPRQFFFCSHCPWELWIHLRNSGEHLTHSSWQIVGVHVKNQTWSIVEPLWKSSNLLCLTRRFQRTGFCSWWVQKKRGWNVSEMIASECFTDQRKALWALLRHRNWFFEDSQPSL